MTFESKCSFLRIYKMAHCKPIWWRFPLSLSKLANQVNINSWVILTWCFVKNNKPVKSKDAFIRGNTHPHSLGVRVCSTVYSNVLCKLGLALAACWVSRIVRMVRATEPAPLPMASHFSIRVDQLVSSVVCIHGKFGMNCTTISIYIRKREIINSIMSSVILWNNSDTELS